MRNRHIVTALLSGLVLLGLSLPANVSAPARAADPSGDAAKRFGAELVPADAIGFASFRVSEIVKVKWVDSLLKKLEKASGAELEQQMDRVYFAGKPSNVERMLFVMADNPDEDPLQIVTSHTGFDRKALMDHVEKLKLKEQHVGEKTIYYPDEPESRHSNTYCAIDDKTLVFGPFKSTKKYLAALADKNTSGPLFEALKKLDASAQAVVVVNPSRVPLPGPLPPEIRPLETLSRARWIALEGTYADGFKAVVKVECSKEKDVADIKKALETGQSMLVGVLAKSLKDKGFYAEVPSTAKVLEQVLSELKGAKVESRDQLVQAKLQVKVEGELLATALDEGIASVRMAANRAKSMSNLRQIAIAFNTMDAVESSLSGPAICSKDGKPLLSWRVAILPYIEEDDLYKQFKLDEPWDSEHNKKLLEKMPGIYAPLADNVKDKTATCYKVFVGKDAWFEANKKFSIAQVSNVNGTSNTILAIEAGEPVPWTKPEDIPFDLKKPLPKLVGPFKGKLLVAFFDAHVATIPADVDPKKLRGSISREGSELNLNTPDKPKGSGSTPDKPKGSGSTKPSDPRARSKSNLRQIAIACNAYDSDHGELPTAAIYSDWKKKTGKPLLSWRVAILPYIEENILYHEFKFDEPWDSEHNKKLLEKMPSIYAPTTGNVKDKTTTYYKVFVGKSAAFEENTPIPIAQISNGNGTSNTILAIEAGDPVPWTKPEDIPFDLKKPLPKLEGPFKGILLLAFADGSVRSIPADVDPKRLRGSIMREESKLNLNTPDKPKGSGSK